MNSFARLIYKSCVTYFPTNFPVQFYGLPDGKVYLVYARFYDIRLGESGIEYVFAEHKEFSYDYKSDKLIPEELSIKKSPIYAEMVDKPNPKFKILRVSRTLNSFAEAFVFLDKKALEILRNTKKTIQLIDPGLALNQSATA